MKIVREEGDACPVQAKFLTTRRELCSSLVERDGEVDVVLTALVCNEHPLLVGPPGTAKSLLLDALMAWTSGRRFSALLTKFTTPDELFGPISVRGLKEDVYRRVTTGKMPEAHLCFLDEVFKASSAILNTLLRILNERVYEDGDGTPARVPLLLCVSASNEWPDPQDGGKELAAVFDRFLFRRTVRPILSRAGRHRLLWVRDHAPKLSTSITPEEVHKARADSLSLPWSDDARGALETILEELSKEGIHPGDRRQHKAVSAAQAFAYLDGACRVEPEHLEILASVLWDDPQEQPQKCASVIAKIANPVGMRVNGLLMEAEQILAGCDVRNLGQAATATAKLGEIDKTLGTLKGDGRVGRARTYVREQVRRLKLASLDSI